MQFVTQYGYCLETTITTILIRCDLKLEVAWICSKLVILQVPEMKVAEVLYDIIVKHNETFAAIKGDLEDKFFKNLSKPLECNLKQLLQNNTIALDNDGEIIDEKDRRKLR